MCDSCRVPVPIAVYSGQPGASRPTSRVSCAKRSAQPRPAATFASDSLRMKGRRSVCPGLALRWPLARTVLLEKRSKVWQMHFYFVSFGMATHYQDPVTLSKY